MHFQKLSSGYSYLSTAFSKGRKQNRLRYEVIESTVLEFFSKEDWQAVSGGSESAEVKEARVQLDVTLARSMPWRNKSRNGIQLSIRKRTWAQLEYWRER
jgi:hypothetical protein